jgi:transcriptional regulator with XRE-family HTH domain
MDIRKILSQLRRNGLSQAAIGKKIGCAQSTVSDMENGHSGVKRPSYELTSKLIALAKRHGISEDGSEVSQRRKKSENPVP